MAKHRLNTSTGVSYTETSIDDNSFFAYLTRQYFRAGKHAHTSELFQVFLDFMTLIFSSLTTTFHSIKDFILDKERMISLAVISSVVIPMIMSVVFHTKG